MRYRLLIFDFDGTLADSLGWFFSVINQIADELRFNRIETHEYEELRGFESHQIFKRLDLPFWKVPKVARRLKALMAENIERISLFPGIAEMLRELSAQGAVLAIVSSNSKENVQKVLGPEVAALIQHYECGVAMFGKQAKFKKILRRSRIPREQALCIGDEIRDLQASKKEGIAFGAVSWGYATIDALKTFAPEEKFDSVGDIVRVASGK